MGKTSGIILNTLSDRLKFTRGLRSLTQSKLAKLVNEIREKNGEDIAGEGAQQQYISMLEKGDIKHSKMTYELAQALGISHDWLLHGRGEMDRAAPEQRKENVKIAQLTLELQREREERQKMESELLAILRDERALKTQIQELKEENSKLQTLINSLM